MIRCGHATALRTQFTTSMALRASRSLPWTKASHALLSFAPHSKTGGSIGTRKIAAVSRRFSTHADDLKPNAQDEDTPSSTIMLSARNPRRSKYQRDEEDPLLRIASARPSRGDKDSIGVSKKVVEMELTWLKDRVLLAQRVEKLLKKDNIALAAALVRSIRNAEMDCDVAWNHILQYCMRKGNPRAAFKFWNDMKKRGLKPNEFAYTIMLNGLAKSRANKYSGFNPVRTARSIYASLFTPNSHVKPTLYQVNAMLNVCAQHVDMDALWEVAGDLPEEGPLSPNSMAYTIILNAIRRSAQVDVAALSSEEPDKAYRRRLQCVSEGKRVWSDVMYRWKKGHLTLENEAVSAMAGVLWEGTGDRHYYEVLKLYRQTTGIPILADVPSPEHPQVSRRSNARRRNTYIEEFFQDFVENKETEDVPFVDEKGKPLGLTESDPTALEEAEAEEESFEDVFDPIVPADVQPSTDPIFHDPLSSTPQYINLGNRELSIIMETCLMMEQPRLVGTAYWDHLTKGDHEYRIEPDGASLVRYLRILRVGRSSRASVEVIRDQMIPAGHVQGKAFHIALSACRRDRRNQNVLKNANELLKLMDSALMIPDTRAMMGYIDLIKILNEDGMSLMSLVGLDGNKQRTSGNLGAVGRSLSLDLLTVAMGNLRPLVAKLNEAMESPPSLARPEGAESDLYKNHRVHGAQAVAVLEQVRQLIDSILKLANESLLSDKNRERYKEESLALRKYSNAQVVERYNTMWIYPTPGQIAAFQRQKEDQASRSDAGK